MKTNKNNIIIADCMADEILPFVETFRYKNRPFTIKSHIANWKRTGKFSEIKRYAKYFSVAFKYFWSRKKYNTVVGWQQFYALIFCFYSWLFGTKKVNTVIALNFTYKEKSGFAGKVYKWFMQKCVSTGYLDYLHVPSNDYADSFSKDFAFPRENIIVNTFGIVDNFSTLSKLPVPDGYEKDGYALAIGRSNRDYDFLISAWQDIDYPLVIISDTYKGDTDNDKINILRNVAGDVSHPWIANCGLMVIPIDDGSICSGDTVLLTAMSLERKIIVTAPSTLAEMYITDGENALLSSKKSDELKKAVLSIIGTEVYNDLGRRARESFINNFSRQGMGLKITKILMK